MSFAGILSGIGVAKSLLGGDPASGYYAEASKSLKQKQQLLELMMNLAKSYDPHADTQKAVDFASQTAGRTLGHTLSGLDQQYQAAGESPTGDTRFRVSAQGATDRALDPLKQFAADRSANELMSKLQAFQIAAGADNGQVANSYMQMANANRQDMSGALGVLGSSIDKLSQKSQPPTDTKKKKLIPAEDEEKFQINQQPNLMPSFLQPWQNDPRYSFPKFPKISLNSQG